MKKYCILLMFVFSAVVANAQFDKYRKGGSSSFKSSTANKNVEQPALSKLMSTAKKLSDEQISELYEKYTDDKGVDYLFVMNFGRQALNEKRDGSKIKKFAKSGEVPCRLTASLYETKEIKGKKAYKRVNGTLKFYIVDSQGRTVVQESKSLSSMCPS